MQDKESDDPLEPFRNNGEGPRSLRIENFSYHPNTLTELRKIAEKNPELAEKIVDSQTKAAKWFGRSERFGMAVAGLVFMSAVVGFVTIVVQLGWWQSFAFLILLLCLSHVIRTILTGEWSDTSWFGRALKRLGASPTDED